MKISILTIPVAAMAGAGLLGIIVAGALGARTGAGAKKPPIDPGNRTPVLVELFTSEGCSSCPSADEVLAKLQRDQPIANTYVIAMSEHVDYWNYIGWSDPFSSREFSDRQRAYGNAFRLNSVYTPQMVVNGQAEFVGSDRGQAVAAIERARSAATAKVTVQAAEDKGAQRLQIQVDNLPGGRRGDTADVMLAITEDNLRSNVSRGENTGRVLAHTAVVRQLRSLGTVSNSRAFKAEPSLTLDRSWKRGDLSAVVFVQERNSRRILGSGMAAIK